MTNRDVLLELRAWRDEFARLHGYDIHAMAAALRELDSAGQRKVVRGQPRPPAVVRMPIQAPQPTEAAVAVPPGSTPPEEAPAAEH